jgi:uncharacterized protein YecT (DUF1311 family)
MGAVSGMRTAVLSVLTVACVASAAAQQTGPSFDCARATSPVEKSICADKEAAAADRAMAEAYRRLLSSLATPGARAHLQRDQNTWLMDLSRVCLAPAAGSRAGRDLPTCLRELAAARAERLASLPGGDNYPFVGERRLLERGRRGGVPYAISVSYAVFERAETDYTRANSAIRRWVDTFAAETRPPMQVVPGGPDLGWFLDSGHVVLGASRDLVTIAAHWLVYTGGAHPNNGRTAWHVDLATGRLLGLDDLLDRGSGWQDGVTRLVRADLKRQFEERPGFDDSLEPASLRKLVTEPHRWIFTRDNVLLTFDPYAVGPYAAGPYDVVLRYADLATYIRKDGPLRHRAR